MLIMGGDLNNHLRRGGADHPRAMLLERFFPEGASGCGRPGGALPWERLARGPATGKSDGKRAGAMTNGRRRLFSAAGAPRGSTECGGVRRFGLAS
jgi:hypothetical protein